MKAVCGVIRHCRICRGRVPLNTWTCDQCRETIGRLHELHGEDHGNRIVRPPDVEKRIWVLSARRALKLPLFPACAP